MSENRHGTQPPPRSERGRSPYQVSVTATANGFSSSQSFAWAVTPYVLLAGMPDQSSLFGDSPSLAAVASAPGGSLQYSATGLPPGLSIDLNTGVIGGTVAASASASAPYAVTVTASVGAFSTSQRFLWNVNGVLLSGPADQNSTTGDVVSLQVAARSASGAPTFSATGLPSGLNIDAASGAISGTLANNANEDGPYTVTVTASSGVTSNSATFTWNVSQHISFTDLADQASVGGDTVALPVDAGDPDGDPLTYTATGLPLGLSIDPNTGAITGTIASAAVAATPYSVTVTASDGSHANSLSFAWTVAAVGIVPPGDQSSAANTLVSLPLQGSSASGAALTYSAAGLPPGLGIDPSTGLIAGTLAATAYQGGPYLVTVTVTDGSNTADQTFTWDVTGIDLVQPADQTSTEGQTVQLQVVASDPAGQPLTFSAGGLPDGVTIDPASGLISGTLAPGAAGNGPLTVTVVATDGSISARQSFQWLVNPRVAVTAPADQSNQEGDAVALQVSAQDTQGLPVTFTADGLPDGLAIDPTTGRISGTIAAGASKNGPFTVTVTATEGSTGYSGQATFGWDVPPLSNSPPTLVNPGNQENTESTGVSLQLAATDPDGDLLTFGATGLPDGLALDPFTGLISGTLANKSSATSVFTVGLTVDDYHGGTAQQSFTWTIDSAALSAQGVPLTADEGVLLAEPVVATFTDQNLSRQASDFTALIDWGDGSPAKSGQVDGQNGAFTVSGSHRYTSDAAQAVTVTVADAVGDTTTASSTLTVKAPQLQASGLDLSTVVATPSTWTVATFADSDSYRPATTYTATIAWGDGSSGPAEGVEGTEGSFEVRGTHAYAVPGSYVVVTTIADQENDSTQTTSLVTVGQVMTGRQADLSVGAFQLGGPSSTADNFTASVQWGDGLQGSGVVSGAAGQWTVSSTHVYVVPGVYAVTATLTSMDMRQPGSVSATGIVRVAGEPAQVDIASAIAPGDNAPADPIVAYFASSPAPVSGAGTVVIDWNNGQQTAAEVTGTGGLFAVRAPGPFPTDAARPLSVLLKDGLGRTAAVAAAEFLPATDLTPKFIGPQVIPGSSMYEYEVAIPKTPFKDVTYGKWTVDNAQVAQVILQGQRYIGGNVTDFRAVVRFQNEPGVVHLKLTGAKVLGNRDWTPPPLEIVVFGFALMYDKPVGKITLSDATGAYKSPTKGDFTIPDKESAFGAFGRYQLTQPEGVKYPDKLPWQHSPGSDATWFEGQRKRPGFPFPERGVEIKLVSAGGDPNTGDAKLDARTKVARGISGVFLSQLVQVVFPPGYGPEATDKIKRELYKKIQIGFIQTVTNSGSASYGEKKNIKGTLRRVPRYNFSLDWLSPSETGKPGPDEVWPWYGGASTPRQLKDGKLAVLLAFKDGPSFGAPFQWKDRTGTTWYAVNLEGDDRFKLHIAAQSLDSHVNGNQADLLNNGFNGDQRFFAIAVRDWTAHFEYDLSAKPADRLNGTKVATIDDKWRILGSAESLQVDVVPATIAVLYPYTTWTK